MTAIRTEKLQKYYGQVHALDGLTLQVEAGTIFGFLGPNGAGKSTTIRLLTGLARPTGGQAWVAGMQTGHHAALAARIGYLPEVPSFYNWMTPVEFLDYVGRLFGVQGMDRKKRSAELLDQVGLSEEQKRRITGFSRGMRQRLGLAQALYNRPEVLFLDEPISALDPAGRKEIIDMIQQLRGQTTVFMSTHILADVERVCDTIGIINHGKMIVEAPQNDLLARYTIPAFDLECEPGFEESFKTWLDQLKPREWIDSVSQNGLTARAAVKDLATSRQLLLESIVLGKIPLRRFETVTPSLEDIFLRLVNQKGGEK
jgi:ABC-2 type transport system ATP-binding protein